jgi:hypothetical protein
MNVVKGLNVGIAFLALAASASAQTGAAAPESEQQRQARAQVSMVEGVLERAVQNGVDNLRRKVREVMPDDALLLQGQLPQVRGFRLEGYGYFFDVEVPGLRPSMAWTLRTMNQTGGVLARDLAQMRRLVQSLTDQRVRAELDVTLQRIQRNVVGPTPPPGPERVEAAALAPPPAPPPPVLDPSETYTQEVKSAIVDAMIQFSGSLDVGANEWLTVAAKDNEPSNPLTQGDPDVMTILLRIKGSDLTAYRAGRLTLDEARARVEVREF